MRREFSARVKVTAFDRCCGRCEECTRFLMPGDIRYDHRIPDASGGEPTIENCQVLCRGCHDQKTRKHDVPVIAKGKRVRAHHIGIRKRETFRGWRRMNGEIVRANERSR